VAQQADRFFSGKCLGGIPLIFSTQNFKFALYDDEAKEKPDNNKAEPCHYHGADEG